MLVRLNFASHQALFAFTLYAFDSFTSNPKEKQARVASEKDGCYARHCYRLLSLEKVIYQGIRVSFFFCFVFCFQTDTSAADGVLFSLDRFLTKSKEFFFYLPIIDGLVTVSSTQLLTCGLGQLVVRFSRNFSTVLHATTVSQRCCYRPEKRKHIITEFIGHPSFAIYPNRKQYHL